jgi:hypothetical protein
MDVGDWIALGASIVAVIAAGVAIWQAGLARRSAGAADGSADAAEAQGRTAEAIRHSADAPRFAVAAEPPVNGVSYVKITMRAGVPGLHVGARWKVRATWLIANGESNETIGPGDEPSRQIMVLDGSTTIPVRVPSEATSGEITVDLDWREIEAGPPDLVLRARGHVGGQHPPDLLRLGCCLPRDLPLRPSTSRASPRTRVESRSASETPPPVFSYNNICHYLPLHTLTCENSSDRPGDSGVTVTVPRDRRPAPRSQYVPKSPIGPSPRTHHRRSEA